ncbi:unnamed protein product, partial [Prorocentrum cordatum]
PCRPRRGGCLGGPPGGRPAGARARMRRPRGPHAAAARALLLGAATPACAWWPFEAGEGEDQRRDGPSGPSGLPPGMEFAFGGVPVIHVDSHFGFDPFEDIHRNMGRLMEKSSKDNQMLLPAAGDASPLGAPASPLEVQLGSILELFGELHSGQFGRAEGSFEVSEDDPSRFRISALLPGYKLDPEGGGDESPDESQLSVRAVGKRSLVVSGSQPTGPLIRTWQRSFSLPRGSKIDEVAVTYSATTGNLTVEVPRGNATEGEEETRRSPRTSWTWPGSRPRCVHCTPACPAWLARCRPAGPRAAAGAAS